MNILKNKFLIDLYNNFKNIYENLNIDKLNIIKIDIKKEEYLKDNNFTSSNIKKKILSKLNNSYQISDSNKNTIIYFTSKKNITKIPVIINHMFIIINLLKLLFKNNEKQNITYFETFEKKKFPLKKKILGPNEVNSGLTFLDSHTNGDIILYRREEVLKVLIHELIHSNLIDYNLIYSNKNKEFSNNFCVNYTILLNEAFTETFATILNIYYINIYFNLGKKDLNKMILNEIKYSNYISSKILYYYKIDHINDIIKLNDKCNSTFPQKTNVFSYYILKNILLTKYDKFTEIYSENNINYKIINNKFIEDLIHLILNNINLLKIDNVSKDKSKSLKLCFYEI